MKIEYNFQYIEHVWRCRSSNLLHDIKKNIRRDSIFESINVRINVIYYLTFNCFLNHYSINQTYISNENFCSIMGISKTARNIIVDLFQYFRN